jgi:hypothetical protein
MNKFIESDIRSGFTLLGTGLCHILVAIANKELDEYELKTNLLYTTIADVITCFDSNVEIVGYTDIGAIMKVNNTIIYIDSTTKGCCFHI